MQPPRAGEHAHQEPHRLAASGLIVAAQLRQLSARPNSLVSTAACPAAYAARRRTGPGAALAPRRRESVGRARGPLVRARGAQPAHAPSGTRRRAARSRTAPARGWIHASGCCGRDRATHAPSTAAGCVRGSPPASARPRGPRRTALGRARARSNIIAAGSYWLGSAARSCANRSSQPIRSSPRSRRCTVGSPRVSPRGYVPCSASRSSARSSRSSQVSSSHSAHRRPARRSRAGRDRAVGDLVARAPHQVERLGRDVTVRARDRRRRAARRSR